MCVQSLGWEDPLEEDRATHSSIPDWRLPWTEKPGAGYSQWSLEESDTTEVTQHARTTQAFRSALNLAAFGVPVS